MTLQSIDISDADLIGRHLYKFSTSDAKSGDGRGSASTAVGGAPHSCLMGTSAQTNPAGAAPGGCAALAAQCASGCLSDRSTVQTAEMNPMAASATMDQKSVSGVQVMTVSMPGDAPTYGQLVRALYRLCWANDMADSINAAQARATDHAEALLKRVTEAGK